MKWVACTSEIQWQQSALNWLYQAVDRQLQHQQPLTIALCGGQTPWSLFQQALQDNRLPWDKLTLVPTDERWVDLTSERSNEGRLNAIFESTPATISGFRSVADTQEQSLDIWSTPGQPLPKIALLGMGTDGHFASIFTEADYQQSGVIFATEHESECRLSWSSQTLIDTPEIAFFIRGSAKQKVFAQNIGVVHHFLKQRADAHVFWVE
jgi:6-phosphogluconolactonase